MCRIFQKVPLSTFYILSLFSPKHPIVEKFFGLEEEQSQGYNRRTLCSFTNFSSNKNA